MIQSNHMSQYQTLTRVKPTRLQPKVTMLQRFSSHQIPITVYENEHQ